MAAGAVPRALLLRYGLPDFFHPDEINLLHETYKFWFSIFEGNFALSTNVFSHLLTVAHGVHLVGCRLSHACASLGEFRRMVLLDDPALFLTGRVLAAAADVVNIYLTYRLGRRLFGETAGLIAGGLYAVAAIPILASIWVKMDSVSLLFILLAQLAILGADDGRLRGGWYTAGVLTSLAVATRINAAPLVICLVMAYLLPRTSRDGASVAPAPPRRWRTLASVLAVVAIVYLVVTFRLTAMIAGALGQKSLFWSQPYLEVIWAKTSSVWTGGQWQSPGAIIADNLGYYATLLPQVLGALTAAGLAIATVLAGWTGDRSVRLSLIFPVLSIVPLALFPFHAAYYVLALLPYLFCYLAGGVQGAAVRLGAWTRAGRLAPAGLAALVLIGPVYVSSLCVRYLTTNVDTRIRARDWIQAHVAPGEAIAIEKYHELPTLAPPIAETAGENEQKAIATRALGLGSAKVREARLAEGSNDGYVVINLSLVPVFGRLGEPFENAYDFDRLRAQGAKYVVLGTYIPATYVAGTLYPRFEALYGPFRQRLTREAELVARFGPQWDERTSRLMRSLFGHIIDPPFELYRLTSPS